MKRRAFALLILVLAGPLAAADLSTLTGKKHVGDVAGIADGVLTIRTEAGPVGVAVKDVFVVDFGKKVEAPAKDAKYDEIELVDGSVIRLSGLAIKGKAVEPALLAAGAPAPKFAIPLETLFYYQRGADDAKARANWRKLLAGRGKRDLFVVRAGDDLSPVPGTVLGGSDAGDAIEFEKEAGAERVNYKLTRATGGLVFNQPPRGEIPPTLCKVHDVFGNSLVARDLKVSKDGFAITTVAGATFTYAPAALAKLDFSQGNIAYLSDMETTVTAPPQVPGEPYFTYLRDKNQDGAPLKLDGVSYAKGIWLYPDTTLAYKLNGDYRELKMVAGIDESVPVANSTVRLVVLADGKELYAAKVSRKDAAKTLNLDVKGVKELRITLERDGLYLGNQINLAEARVQK
ncbi:MAG: NPCBM/NEW2 domain-containing protein [Planctomycetia bacterium]|nr:NPCBM/NEW2 domain-containing protein [Planctomycetia bacterium]